MTPRREDGFDGADIVGESQRMLTEQARIVRHQRDHAARILRVMLAVGGVTVTTASILVTVLLSAGIPFGSMASSGDSQAGSPANASPDFYTVAGEVWENVFVATTDLVTSDCASGVFGCEFVWLGVVFVLVGVFLIMMISIRIMNAVQAALKVLSPDDITDHRYLDGFLGRGIRFVAPFVKGARLVVSLAANNRLICATRRLKAGVVKSLEDITSWISGDERNENEGRDTETGNGTAGDADIGEYRAHNYIDLGPDSKLQTVAEEVTRSGEVSELVAEQSASIENNLELMSANRKQLGYLHQQLMDALEFLVLGVSVIMVGLLLVALGV